MQEKINMFKEIKKKNFIKKLKEDKNAVALLVSDVLRINKYYIESHIVYEDEFKPYDLVTKVTSNYIKIKATKYNKLIQIIKSETPFYKKTYNEEKGYYKIKIDINKIFDEHFDMILNDSMEEMREQFKTNNKEALLDLCTSFELMNSIPEEELKRNIQVIKESDRVTRIRITIPIK